MALSMFEKFLYEAPGDDPHDVQQATESPPDVPADAPAESGDPPDIPDDAGDVSDEPAAGDGPPDMQDDGFGDDTGYDDTGGGEEEGSEGGEENSNNLGLDEKISAIMNMNLYQRFLSLLNTIAGQLTMLKNNSDVLFSLSTDSLDTIDQLKKLDENIRLYLKNSFLNENYSKNLLFFNKCLNLLKLLNDVFDKNVKKGINAMK